MVRIWFAIFVSAIIVAKAEEVRPPPVFLGWTESRPETVRIGDRLDFSVRGFEKAGVDPVRVKFRPAEEKKDFIDLGWHALLSRPLSEDQLQIFFVPLRGGSVTLPGLEFFGEDGKVLAVSEPFILKVEPNAEGMPEPLQGPVRLAFPFWTMALILFLFLVIAGGLGWALVKYWRRPVPVAIEVRRPLRPPPPAHVVALRDLEALEAKRYWEKKLFKPHYFAVSEILKIYLGSRYGFDAPESTTSEMLALMKKHLVEDRVTAETARIFERLDLVKFTDHLPDSDEARDLILWSRALVESTKRETLQREISHAV